MAKRFVQQNPGKTRIHDLLSGSPQGQVLLHRLEGRDWGNVKEIWWELSRRLAKASWGDVYCFGSDRLTRSRDARFHESRFNSGVYADTTFEKVELPVLENNPRVENIYYNHSRI